MGGVQIKVNIRDRDLRKRMTEFVRRGRDLTPAFEQIGDLLVASVEENFRASGRPAGWRPSKRAERHGGKTLVDTARLKNSITKSAEPARVRVGTNVKYAAVHQFGAAKGSFGTFTYRVREHQRKRRAKSFAPAPKRGGKRPNLTTVMGMDFAAPYITVKAHDRTAALPWGDIPARPFLVVQDEDEAEIRDILADFMAGAFKEDA